ncbi:MAG: glycerate kinase [Eubacteriales bacterium]|nr:glycerate kinase [Eubacteriales bacterium]
MKKYVLIPDSFKGTLNASEICEIMSKAICSLQPDAEIVSIPVADGGEGTVDAFLQAVGGERINVQVKGPYGETLTAAYGRLNATTAVVEMAAAAGLPMVGENRNAEATTTFGVGELIAHALEHSAKEIILGLGGSATNDGGCGMAAALGVQFLDEAEQPFVPVGKTLNRISRIDMSRRNPLVDGCHFRVMCDIDNPLCGLQGASAIFGPQKGADAAMIERLDNGLHHMAQMISRDVACDVLAMPGGGAAGGMGAGAVAFLGGQLQMGIDTVLDVVHFDELVSDASLVLTGEGRLDGQSLRGKVVIGVARHSQGKPVIAIVGSIADDISQAYHQGVTAVFSINRSPMAYEQAILHSKENLFATTQDVVRCACTGIPC